MNSNQPAPDGFKNTMPVYFRLVNTTLAHLAVGMGLFQSSEYWYIREDLVVCHAHWTGSKIDTIRFGAKNVFRSKALATIAVLALRR